MAPYEETFKNATKVEREELAERVCTEMEHSGLLEAATTVAIRAGKDYYDELVSLLEDNPE